MNFLSKHWVNASHFWKSRFSVSIVIFLIAFGVRVLSWHDTRLEVGKIQTGVTADYQRIANLLMQGGMASFFSSSSQLADLNNLGHPPGYPILIAFVYSVFGQSITALQFVQLIFDALSAVMILLIISEVLTLSTAFIAGLLAALSPQFAWNSVLLLPDSIAVFPILVAVYFVARGLKKPRFVPFIIAGTLIGISCWLRANAMFLTVFIASVPVLVLRTKKAFSYAFAVIAVTILIILPLTIRNAIVFHRFIPLSLGAGQTFLEGIADYDEQGRFGIPRTDVGIMKQEAEQFDRPDYYGTMFNPDGIERERARLRRGLKVIRTNPGWFAGVMIRRASSMLRLERSRLISLDPAVTHSLDVSNKQAVWSAAPVELIAQGTSSVDSTSLVMDQWLAVTGTASNYGDQFSVPTESVNKNTDYLFVIPLTIESGRMRLSVENPNGRILSSTVVETSEAFSRDNQPVQQLQLPFVASRAEPLRLVLSNEASNPPKPVIRLGTVKLFELGLAKFLWTRYPRLVVHAIQKIFLTAIMLPLAIAGVILLIVRKYRRVLPILLVVPIYYLCVQSLMHTEYRYVLAVDYFLFALVGVALATMGASITLKIFPSRAASLQSSR
jgi:hypothetical protein